MSQPPDLPDWHQPDEPHDPAWGASDDTQAMPTVPVEPVPAPAPLPTQAMLPVTPPPIVPPVAPVGPTGPVGPPPREPAASPWPWILGGLALVLVLAVVIGLLLANRDGGTAAVDATTSSTALAATSTTVAATTTSAKATTTSTVAATTTTVDRPAEAVSFARRLVAQCAVDHPDDVSADRPNGIKSSGTVSDADRRYAVVDAKGVSLVVDLKNSVITGPGGPTSAMPKPYDACDASTFVGTRADAATTTSTTS